MIANIFYALQSPTARDEPVYGLKAWLNRYPVVEWANSMDLPGIICPVNSGHQRAGNRVMDLTVILPSPRIGDFIWTWYSEWLMTDRVLHLFQNAGFTGFEPRPVKVEKVKRVKKGTEVSIPPLWELKVTGKGGDTDPASGIRILETCDACSLIKYSSFRNGLIVDENNWDGSDFFTVNGYPKFILVTERVKELIIREKLVNCALIPSHELRWDSGTRPEETFAKSKALDALLADLPHTFPVEQLPKPEELDKRISRAQSITGTGIKREGTNLIWNPILNPPGTDECLAWAWVLRPDFAAIASARTKSDLQWAMLELGKYYEPR